MTNANLILTTLADPTRRAIVERLRDGPLTVGELTKATPVTQSAVSQHLGVLKAAELVLERREGTRRYYSLDPSALGELRRYVDGLWTDALSSFGQGGPEA
jgi:DNA-binding transcriptional ArsR family regulator